VAPDEAAGAAAARGSSAGAAADATRLHARTHERRRLPVRQRHGQRAGAQGAPVRAAVQRGRRLDRRRVVDAHGPLDPAPIAARVGRAEPQRMRAVGPSAGVRRRTDRAVRTRHGPGVVAAARLFVHDLPVELDPPGTDPAVVARVERDVLDAAEPGVRHQPAAHPAQRRRGVVRQVHARVAQSDHRVPHVAPTPLRVAADERLDALRRQPAQLLVHPLLDRRQAARPAPQPGAVRRVEHSRRPAGIAEQPSVEVDAGDRGPGGRVERQRRGRAANRMRRPGHVAHDHPLARLRPCHVDDPARARDVGRGAGCRLPLGPGRVLRPEAGTHAEATRVRRRRKDERKNEERSGDVETGAHALR
jgi:hypothetical protein